MTLSKEAILKNDGNPMILDQLDIRTQRNYIVARFGLGAELYVAPRDPLLLREQMLATAEDYYRLFEDKLDHYLLSDQRRAPAIKGDPFPLFRHASEARPPESGFAVVLYGENLFPEEASPPTPYSATFLAECEQRNELSFFSCYMPVAAEHGGTSFPLLLASFLRWCNLLHPVHGGAGFSVVLPIGSEEKAKYAYAAMKRHPGLDFIDGVVFSGEVEQSFNRIKVVNWLTALGDDILNELGGIEAARAALEPDCTLHPFNGGVVIQAGAVPQLGDSYHGLIPERYRKVAHFTRPVRFEDYHSPLFRVFPPLDGLTETRAWVRRFD